MMNTKIFKEIEKDLIKFNNTEKTVYSKREIKSFLNGYLDEQEEIPLESIYGLEADIFMSREYIFAKSREGVLAIPYKEIVNKSLNDTYKVLDVDDMFLIKDNRVEASRIIDECKNLINLLSNDLFK